MTEELYPGAKTWEDELKDKLRFHQRTLIPSDYAGIVPLPFNDHQYLVTTTDGIGSKILLAESEEDYFNLGIDVVAMNVNDLICTGARPLAFTNVLTRAHYNPMRDAALLKGMMFACEKSGMILAAGETADVPQLVHSFDLVGQANGIVEKDQLYQPLQNVTAGNFLYGIQSTGPHSNGYTLIRRHFDKFSTQLKAWIKRPTQLYPHLIPDSTLLLGMAHLTGGGWDKLARIIPPHLKAKFEYPKLSPEWIELLNVCDLSIESAAKIFNLGIGMVLVSKQELPHTFKDLISLGSIE